jgi:hypothetical protein
VAVEVDSMPRIIIGVVAVLMAGPAIAEPVRLGERVRIAVPGDPAIVGYVLATDDTFVSIRSESEEEVRVPWRSVRKVEISHGRRSGFVRGAAIGGLVGMIGLGALGSQADQCFDCQSGEHGTDLTGPGMVVGLGLGALLGGGIGALTRVERWETVRAPQLAVGVTPQRRGIGASVALRF